MKTIITIVVPLAGLLCAGWASAETGKSPLPGSAQYEEATRWPADSLQYQHQSLSPEAAALEIEIKEQQAKLDAAEASKTDPAVISSMKAQITELQARKEAAHQKFRDGYAEMVKTRVREQDAKEGKMAP